MIKNLLSLVLTIENRTGHFMLEHGTEIQVAKEMGVQFLKWIGQLEDQAKAQQEQESQKNEEKLPEEQKSEEINGNQQ